MRRAASGRPRRGTGSRAIRREILVFTEGEKTEDGYLLPWRRAHRDTVLLEIDPFHGVPQSLVQQAVATKKAEARDQRRGRGRAHDEIWCVFDIDAHPNVSEAVQLAEAHGIGLAISNPCIELWFILHFQDQTAYLSRHNAQSAAAALLGCGKVLTRSAMDLLHDCYEDARDRAQRLDAKHEGDGSPPRSNPSSSVWSLIEAIRA